MLLLFLLVFYTLNAQETLSQLLKKNNTHSIPYISVQELAMPKTEAIVLDAREKKEFDISHIRNAIHVGYDFFNLDTVAHRIPDKKSIIVVYCSIGIRSEDIGEKLKKAGYENVRNLYGGIFEWKNRDFPIYNRDQIETDSVHVFSEAWRKWLTNGITIYD